MKNLKREQFAGSNFHYMKYSFDYFLESMRKLGIRTIEFYLACPHFVPEDLTVFDVGVIAKKIRDAGLSVCCTTYEQCRYPVNIATENRAVRERSIKTLQKVIEFSEILESPLTQVLGGQGSYDFPDEDAWKRAVESFGILSETAEKHRVCMVIEEASRHVTNTVYSTPLTRKMLDEVDSPWLKAMLDTCAVENAGEDFLECVRLLGPDVRHMHFADGIPGGHFIPGEGKLPLKKYLDILDETGYGHKITFELYNNSYEFEPEYYMKRCFDYLEEVF